jgi:hypothetical protein
MPRYHPCRPTVAASRIYCAESCVFSFELLQFSQYMYMYVSACIYIYIYILYICACISLWPRWYCILHLVSSSVERGPQPRTLSLSLTHISTETYVHTWYAVLSSCLTPSWCIISITVSRPSNAHELYKLIAALLTASPVCMCIHELYKLMAALLTASHVCMYLSMHVLLCAYVFIYVECTCAYACSWRIHMHAYQI